MDKAGLLFEHGAYLLTQLQPRLLWDWSTKPMCHCVASLGY